MNIMSTKVVIKGALKFSLKQLEKIANPNPKKLNSQTVLSRLLPRPDGMEDDINLSEADMLDKNGGDDEAEEEHGAWCAGRDKLHKDRELVEWETVELDTTGGKAVTKFVNSTDSSVSSSSKGDSSH
ncbi:hypothetical protein MBLNU230_g3662t1 [Neophaeotheca triangularis]